MMAASLKRTRPRGFTSWNPDVAADVMALEGDYRDALMAKLRGAA